MRTATGGKMKLQEVAKGCGIASAHLIQDAATFREKIQMALKNDGPHFICAQVEALDPERPPKTKHVLDPRENNFLAAVFPEKDWVKATWTLILLGRQICNPTPKCPDCPVIDLCPYPRKTKGPSSASRAILRTTKDRAAARR